MSGWFSNLKILHLAKLCILDYNEVSQDNDMSMENLFFKKTTDFLYILTIFLL